MNDLIRLYKWAYNEANLLVDKNKLTDVGVAMQEARRGSGKIVLDILEGRK